MKAVTGHDDHYSQHFSIFLRGCKQPNLSTFFRGAKIGKFSDMQYFGYNFLKIFLRTKKRI